MLRIYFLQQWFNFSDPQAEDAIYDSEAMRRFARVERVLEQQFVAREGAGRAHCSGSRFLLPSSVMDANRYASVAFLAVGLAASGCGDHEPVKTTAPPPAAYPAAAPPAEASSVAVGCIARWTAGTLRTVLCHSTVPDKDQVKLDKDPVRLDKICVNDPRIP